MSQAAAVPDNAELLAVARQALATGLQLIHNGRDIRLSPICPPGWRPVVVKVKDAAPNPQEVTQ